MKIHATILPGGFTVSDERARLDMKVVHRALASAYWAVDRRRDQTERAFAHCVALGVYAPDGATVGFGRVLTDHTFRAHLADVMILPAVRGRGLGRALVEAALCHPELATVATWTLTTADAQDLYARYGFRVAPEDPKRMVLDRGRPTIRGEPSFSIGTVSRV